MSAPWLKSESTALGLFSRQRFHRHVKSSDLVFDQRSRIRHAGVMNAGVSARKMARANVTAAIKDAARHRLAVEGAAKLSVRAVARDVGMVSSAVYRYFPTRDDLLTALIVDAYTALGDALEQADSLLHADEVGMRWRAMCTAVRQWAKAHPHEYALIFGSPIPDYQAPQDTIAPAARIPAALLAAIRHGWRIGAVKAAADIPMPDRLRAQIGLVGTELAPDLPPALLIRVAIAWTQLFGMVTFELFGQFVGTLDPADEFFDTTVSMMAHFVGLD